MTKIDIFPKSLKRPLTKDMIPEMEAIANSSREEFYELIRKVQDRIQYYNQQNSERQIE